MVIGTSSRFSILVKFVTVVCQAVIGISNRGPPALSDLAICVTVAYCHGNCAGYLFYMDQDT